MTNLRHFLKPGLGTAIICGILGLILFTLYINRDAIFQSVQDPGEPFQTYIKPTAPDYSNPESWISIPDFKVDPFTEETLGDVFIVVPAVYRGGEHWNLPVDDDRRITKLQRIVRPNYVAPYASAGRLFAPYYRQSSIYTFLTNREDARRAQNLAYMDVKRAFETFLNHSPPERPIIIAGHGQGASHVQRILEDFFQKGDLHKRLAAAYIIDHPLPLDKFETSFPKLKPCETEIDAGCVVAFGAFTSDESVTAKRFISQAKVYGEKDYTIVEGRPLLCVNPLLWNRTTDYAPRRLHKGGIAAEGIDPKTWPAPLVKQTGAQCMDGILLIDKPKSRSLRRPRFKFGAKFRTLPSNLFYEDLRLNAPKRVQTVFDSGILPKRVPLLQDNEIVEVIDSPVTPVDLKREREEKRKAREEKKKNSGK